MITLPNMQGDMTFQEDGHIYSIGTMIVPSVTKIIAPLYDFSGINSEVLSYAANRGTEVHYAIEKFIKYGYQSKLDSDAQPYFEQFLKWYESQPISRLDMCCEIIVYNKTYNYSGCVDIIIYDGTNYHLWDIKTSAVADIDTWAVQLSGYALACKEYKITFKTRNVLQLATDTYKTFKADNVDGIFLSCLNIHNYKNKKK
jgi:hypothetical protein